MDAAAISADNRCPLGQWLHGEARIKFSTLKSYVDCVGKHATFHKEASKVAHAINAKKYTDAETMLNAGTSYSAASNAVATAIIGLRKESGL